MPENKKAKHFRFSMIVTIALSLMGTSVIAVAAILPQLQKDRTNEFAPAAEQIAIRENDADPQASAESKLPLDRNTESGRYTVDKKVQITSDRNNAYIKAALIPQWYDADGRLRAGLGDISDFGLAREPDPVKNIQQYVSSQNESFVILTYRLAPDWNHYWRYDRETGFYHYRDPLRKGQTTEPLILGVEMSADVYELSEGYELRVDVITESIQTNADAASIRAFGRS